MIIVSVIFILSPLNALASGMSREFYPKSDSDYYQKKFSYQLYFSFGTVKVKMTQFKPGLPQTPENMVEIVTWNVKENSFMWMDQKCKGPLLFEYLDKDGKVVDFHTRGETTTYLNEGSCAAGNVVKPSDFNEEKNQYKSDTFGGTKPALTNPPSADGSGGTGDTGFEGVDNGSGDGGTDSGDGGTAPGDGGTDPGGGGTAPGGGSDCSACAVMECPGWDDYMGKLDNIANKIPPAPDWGKVADTFRDSIVPKLITDLGNLLGEAPSTPDAPSQLPGLDDRGISGKQPSMNNALGLKDSGFSSGDIKNQAPAIPEREDPTGGFDLTTNPMDSLPAAPVNPKPGETDAGEWGKNKPKEEDNPFPYPQDKGDPDVGSPPKPGDNGATPPSPGGDVGSAPSPGGDLGNGPSPGGSGGDPNMIDYKPSPGAADGSGGVIGK